MRLRRWVPLLAVLLLVAGACAGDDDTDAGGDEGDGAASEPTTTPTTAATATDPYDGYTSELYADGQNWLCRPDGDDDFCDVDLDATVVQADGTVEVEPHEPAADPAVDCFYVYPTISADASVNADLEPGPNEEGRAVRNQAARFSSLCRLFAPVYRQITLAALGGRADEAARDLAYGDVLDAWKHYVSNDNDGRPVVLMGHSQGSGHLRALISEEIDGVPELQDRLVSALLLGSAVAVPEDEAIGGDFTDVPLCTEEGQAGCVISYASFRSTAPPPATSFFGDVEGPERAACTNPAALGGGQGELIPYFEDTAAFSPDAAATVPAIGTPWVTFPGLLTAECARDGEFDYLEVTVNGDPSDPRIDDIGGDLTPEWGLHLVDANIAMGNLLEVVGAQIATHTDG